MWAAERQQLATAKAECAIATRLSVQEELAAAQQKDKEENDEGGSGANEDFYRDEYIVNVDYE